MILLSGGDETNVEGWRFYECLEMVVIFTKLFAHLIMWGSVSYPLISQLSPVQTSLTLAGLFFYLGQEMHVSFPFSSSVDHPIFSSV